MRSSSYPQANQGIMSSMPGGRAPSMPGMSQGFAGFKPPQMPQANNPKGGSIPQQPRMPTAGNNPKGGGMPQGANNPKGGGQQRPPMWAPID